MDLFQVFIFDLGWIFFATWTMVLAALGVIAFGSDLFPLLPAQTRKPRRGSLSR